MQGGDPSRLWWRRDGGRKQGRGAELPATGEVPGSGSDLAPVPFPRLAAEPGAEF